jgi:hypothetical protein
VLIPDPLRCSALPTLHPSGRSHHVDDSASARAPKTRTRDTAPSVAGVTQVLLDLAFEQWADRGGRGQVAGIVESIFSTFEDLVGAASEDQALANILPSYMG